PCGGLRELTRPRRRRSRSRCSSPLSPTRRPHHDRPPSSPDAQRPSRASSTLLSDSPPSTYVDLQPPSTIIDRPRADRYCTDIPNPGEFAKTQPPANPGRFTHRL